jgi:hypothetical protein
MIRDWSPKPGWRSLSFDSSRGFDGGGSMSGDGGADGSW